MSQHNVAIVLVGFLALFGAACASVPTPPQPSPGSCSFGTLGIEPGDLSPALRRKHAFPDDLTGAVIAEILPGSPAEYPGLKRDDVILRIGNRAISNACDAVEALSAVSCEPVELQLLRGDAQFAVSILPVDRNLFLSRACERGVSTACFRYGWLQWSGSTPEKDLESAIALFRSACDDGVAEACAYLGYELMSQPEEAEEVVHVLSRGCGLGSGAACAHLAYMFATGTLVERDDDMATPLYVRACELGDSRGCFNVGVMYRDGRGVAVDRSRAIAAYEQGCRDGSSTACTDLGWYYQYGEGVEQSTEKAHELYRRGCEGTSCQPSNRRGCVNLGITYKDGIGVAQDATRAAEVFRATCEDEPAPDDIDADSSRMRACSLLGSMYLTGGELDEDGPLGLEYSARGCDGGDAFGCFNAAVVFAAGIGVAVDFAEAARFYDFACDLDDAEACDALGRLYASGSGVEQDPARAKALLEKACAGGFRKACESAESP